MQRVRILKGWSGKVRNEEDEQPDVEDGKKRRGMFVKSVEKRI